MAGGKQKKRSLSESGEQPAPTRKMPPRRTAIAARENFKKYLSISKKSCLIKRKKDKKDQTVKEEFRAVFMTAGQDDGRPNRRITDFILHDETGEAQPLEMLEINNLFITGLILPLERSAEKKKEQGVRCKWFGRIESWNISGYEDGSPVIWISTNIADYDCQKPAVSYKKCYDHFFEKARASLVAYKKLAKSSGGDPEISLDRLLPGMVRSMSGRKYFSGAASLKEFIISHGEFIYKQLIGLDTTLKEDDNKFEDIPALIALRDESKKQANFASAHMMPSNATLTISSGIGDEEKKNQMESVDEEDKAAKLARLWKEQENWKSLKPRKSSKPRKEKLARLSSSSKKFYIKINEDEIANDYPLPAYYKTSIQEADEFIVINNGYGVHDIKDLPRRMLHNWALYNSDSRLISLELLPMQPCSEIDVTVYGSGLMTADDGSGFHLDTEEGQSSSASGAQATDGIPINLSAIKEWMIEFGSSMVSISIRTDMAWYGTSFLK
jgi:DNA (cytosine-5)-methyltransferase 1